MGVNVNLDLSKLEEKFSEDELRAKQAIFAERVAADMNKHCPEDEGTLRDSMKISSNFEEGLIVWNTPYAKDVLERDYVRCVKNPEALPHWPEATKEEKLEDWKDLASRLLDNADTNIGVASW